MPETTMLAVFLKAFGKVPQDLFASFDSRPFDVTSLGQVHDATLADGRRVVVKVQHPMMARALKSDLENVEDLDRLYSVAAGRQSTGVIFAEIRDRVLEECDYALEAEHQALFSANFAGRRELHIPRVVPELSAKTILTTERAEGMSFDDFVRAAAPPARDRAGTAIWTFVNESLYRHGIFNTDIHLDNFRFGPDGRVSFLDFGRVKHLSPEFRAYQRQLTRAILERDKVGCARALDAAGVTHPGFDYDTGFRLFACVFRGLLGEGPYVYRPEHLLRIWRTWSKRNVKPFNFDLGRDHVFLEPFVFGGAALMARLGAAVDARGLLLDLVYEPGEERPRPYAETELAELEQMSDS
jgi:predicted unusual protein kinase regulating ubiquinone biosynthesis (AarF/ABC1/UbiB family)